MFSITLVVVAAVALVMVAFAVLAVYLTSRGDAEMNEELAARVDARQGERASGDVHLFLRYSDAAGTAVLAKLAAITDAGRVAPENLEAAISVLRDALGEATDADASYAHFHFVRFRRDDRPGKTVYVSIRSRTPLDVVSDISDRAAVDSALAAIAALPSRAVVSAVIVEAECDRDPASQTLVPLRGSAPTA